MNDSQDKMSNIQNFKTIIKTNFHILTPINEDDGLEFAVNNGADINQDLSYRCILRIKDKYIVEIINKIFDSFMETNDLMTISISDKYSEIGLILSVNDIKNVKKVVEIIRENNFSNYFYDPLPFCDSIDKLSLINSKNNPDHYFKYLPKLLSRYIKQVKSKPFFESDFNDFCKFVQTVLKEPDLYLIKPAVVSYIDNVLVYQRFSLNHLDLEKVYKEESFEIVKVKTI